MAVPGKKKKKVGRWIAVAIFAVIVYVSFSGNEGIINLLRIQKKNADMRAEIQQLSLTVDSLNKEIFRLKTDSLYIEHIARERLGMAARDEQIFKFVEEGK
jgi:cell division protein FtsB